MKISGLWYHPEGTWHFFGRSQLKFCCITLTQKSCNAWDLGSTPDFLALGFGEVSVSIVAPCSMCLGLNTGSHGWVVVACSEGTLCEVSFKLQPCRGFPSTVTSGGWHLQKDGADGHGVSSSDVMQFVSAVLP